MIDAIIEDLHNGITIMGILDEIVNSQIDRKEEATALFTETQNDPIPDQEANYDPYGFMETYLSDTDTVTETDTKTLTYCETQVEDVPFEELTATKQTGMYTSFGETLPVESKFILEQIGEATCNIIEDNAKGTKKKNSFRVF